MLVLDPITKQLCRRPRCGHDRNDHTDEGCRQCECTHYRWSPNAA